MEYSFRFLPLHGFKLRYRAKDVAYDVQKSFGGNDPTEKKCKNSSKMNLEESNAADNPL